MPTYLTRRVTFTAAHRYWRDDWSDQENKRVFGSWSTSEFHGHEYICDVTVTGEVDRVTGMIIDLALLDRVLESEVTERFDHRDINVDVPEFGDGKLVPTCESLARFIAYRVQRALGAVARVAEVRVAEDETIGAAYRVDGGP